MKAVFFGVAALLAASSSQVFAAPPIVPAMPVAPSTIEDDQVDEAAYGDLAEALRSLKPVRTAYMYSLLKQVATVPAPPSTLPVPSQPEAHPLPLVLGGLRVLEFDAAISSVTVGDTALVTTTTDGKIVIVKANTLKAGATDIVIVTRDGAAKAHVDLYRVTIGISAR